MIAKVLATLNALGDRFFPRSFFFLVAGWLTFGAGIGMNRLVRGLNGGYMPVIGDPTLPAGTVLDGRWIGAHGASRFLWLADWIEHDGSLWSPGDVLILFALPLALLLALTCLFERRSLRLAIAAVFCFVSWGPKLALPDFSPRTADWDQAEFVLWKDCPKGMPMREICWLDRGAQMHHYNGCPPPNRWYNCMKNGVFAMGACTSRPPRLMMPDGTEAVCEVEP